MSGPSAADSLLLFNSSSFSKLTNIGLGFPGANLSDSWSTVDTGSLTSQQRESTGENSLLPRRDEHRGVVGPPADSVVQTPTGMMDKLMSLADGRTVNESDRQRTEGRPSWSGMRTGLRPVSSTTLGPDESNYRLLQNNQSSPHSGTRIDGIRDVDAQPKDAVRELPGTKDVSPQPSQVNDGRGDRTLTGAGRLHSEPGSLRDEMDFNAAANRSSVAAKDAGDTSQNDRAAEEAVGGNVRAPLPRRVNIVEDNSTVTSTLRTPSDWLLDRVRSQVNGVPAANSSLPASGELDERNISSSRTADYRDSEVVKLSDTGTKRLGRIGFPGVGEIRPSDGSAANGNTPVMDVRTETSSTTVKGEEYRKDEVGSNTDTGKPRDPSRRMTESRLQPRALEGDTPRTGSDDKTPERQRTEKEQQEITVGDDERRRLQFTVSTGIVTTGKRILLTSCGLRQQTDSSNLDPYLIRGSFGPPHPPNGISIGSVVFAGLTNVTQHAGCVAPR